MTRKTDKNSSARYSLFYAMHLKYVSFLERHLLLQEKTLALKSKMHANSHSLFWVWEFSKKAVLICFIFYVIIQIYSMAVMVIFQDFSYLGNLIDSATNIVENCVFAYLIKSGIENIPKIWIGLRENKTDDIAG